MGNVTYPVSPLSFSSVKILPNIEIYRYNR